MVMLCGWRLALPKMYRELNLSAIFNILGSASFRTLSITVYLHTILQRQTTDGLKNRLEVKIPPGSTLVDLLKALKVDIDINWVCFI
jgi:hypothetical protein